MVKLTLVGCILQIAAGFLEFHLSRIVFLSLLERLFPLNDIFQLYIYKKQLPIYKTRLFKKLKFEVNLNQLSIIIVY